MAIFHYNNITSILFINTTIIINIMTNLLFYSLHDVNTILYIYPYSLIQHKIYKFSIQDVLNYLVTRKLIYMSGRYVIYYLITFDILSNCR